MFAHSQIDLIVNLVSVCDLGEVFCLSYEFKESDITGVKSETRVLFQERQY